MWVDVPLEAGAQLWSQTTWAVKYGSQNGRLSMAFTNLRQSPRDVGIGTALQLLRKAEVRIDAFFRSK